MRRILIVDDNLCLAEDLAEILEDEGYETQVFDDPRVALAASEQLTFDCALLDVRMPGMDGVSLHQALAERHPAARFVLMTAYTEDDLIAAALAAGVRAVLNKPVPIERLIGVLSEAVGTDVLILEDDRAMNESLSEMLQGHGYRCHAAHSLAEARGVVARARPDVALVDIRLPDGDGTQFALELASERGVDVILTTGFDPSAARRALQESLCDRGTVLTKPFPPTEVLRVLADFKRRAS